MANESLTVRELLNGEDLDPMNIDLHEIKALSNSLPKDGNIDINIAETLATKYLRGADLCSELLAIATAHVQKTDTLKKKAYSNAALVKSAAAGIKTDKSRAWFAEMDEDYIAASNKHSEALAFAKWIGSKYESFIKMHYMCRKMLDREYIHEKASGWERDIIGDGNGEEEKDSTNKNSKEKDDFDLGW